MRLRDRASAGRRGRPHPPPRTKHAVIRSPQRRLALADSEYVGILDADDLAEPADWSGRSVYLDEHPEVGVVGGALLLVTADGRPFYVAAYPEDRRRREALKNRSPSVTPVVTDAPRGPRKKSAGIGNPAVRGLRPLVTRSRKISVVNVPDIVGRYRIHGANASHTDIRRGAESIVQVQAAGGRAKGEARQSERTALAEAELTLALWWAETSARAGTGWRRREKDAWRLARGAARRTSDPSREHCANRGNPLEARRPARATPQALSARTDSSLSSLAG